MNMIKILFLAIIFVCSAFSRENLTPSVLKVKNLFEYESGIDSPSSAFFTTLELLANGKVFETKREYWDQEHLDMLESFKGIGMHEANYQDYKVIESIFSYVKGCVGEDFYSTYTRYASQCNGKNKEFVEFLLRYIEIIDGKSLCLKKTGYKRVEIKEDDEIKTVKPVTKVMVDENNLIEILKENKLLEENDKLELKEEPYAHYIGNIPSTNLYAQDPAKQVRVYPQAPWVEVYNPNIFSGFIKLAARIESHKKFDIIIQALPLMFDDTLALKMHGLIFKENAGNINSMKSVEAKVATFLNDKFQPDITLSGNVHVHDNRASPADAHHLGGAISDNEQMQALKIFVPSLNYYCLLILTPMDNIWLDKNNLTLEKTTAEFLEKVLKCF